MTDKPDIVNTILLNYNAGSLHARNKRQKIGDQNGPECTDPSQARVKKLVED